MSKGKGYVRGNIDRGDYLRVVVTDTAPYEVPIIFSNDGFYKNLKTVESGSSEKKELVCALMGASSKQYTVPYRYNIRKAATSFRRLSLVHPRAQKSVVDFYKKYEELICYYCGISSFTIRAPRRVGSTYYYPSWNSDKNKYKASSVDTTQDDRRVRSPASYFAYRGYNRLHKFFDSSDYIRLEKKYRHMRLLDVSKCFDSLYTHSSAWAVKDIETAKMSPRAMAFGNDFDVLMQKMNYNETNGICIGPEVSRIFSEVIMNRIDQDIEKALSISGLRNRIDYECKRYVDDYHIFANDMRQLDSIQSTISLCLAEYKLHLNEGKAEHHSRPFQTKKSKAIDGVGETLAEFFRKTLEIGVAEGRVTVTPKRIIRHNALLRWFIREVKSCCFDGEVDYDMIANYVISALSKRVQQVTDSYSGSGRTQTISEDGVVEFLSLVLELMFFYYTVHPTVSSSFLVAKSIIQTTKLLSSQKHQKIDFMVERIGRWSMQVVNNERRMDSYGDVRAIPIEILNLIVALSEIEDTDLLNEGVLFSRAFEFERLEYFSIISLLFCIKDKKKFDDLRYELFELIYKRIQNSKGPAIVSEHCHLFLDVIACPYLSTKKRRKLVQMVRKQLELPKMNLFECEKLVKEIELDPWFVQWAEVDLLNMIIKKELSAVY